MILAWTIPHQNLVKLQPVSDKKTVPLCVCVSFVRQNDGIYCPFLLFKILEIQTSILFHVPVARVYILVFYRSLPTVNEYIDISIPHNRPWSAHYNP